MSSFSIYPGNPPATVNLGEAGGTVTNDGPVTVYYRDETPVSSTTNDGSLASGASGTLYGTQYFAADSRSSVHYSRLRASTAAVATIEELTLTLPQLASVSATATHPLGYAQFPQRLTQFGISYYGSNVTASDTDYWSVALVKRAALGGVQTTIATKTTQTIATGGEALSFHVPWVFDAVVFDPVGQLLDNRDMLEIVWTKVGVPTAVSNMIYQARYEPV